LVKLSVLILDMDRKMKKLALLTALCIPIFSGPVFAEKKIVLIIDQVSSASMITIQKRLLAERIALPEEISLLYVDAGFSSESGAALQLIELAPQIVVAPEMSMLKVVAELNLTAKAVLITHGPWVGGSEESLSADTSLTMIRVSTFLDADVACLNWLMKVAPSIRHIGVIGSTDSNVSHMRKVERGFKGDKPKVSGFFVSSLSEATALVASSKTHKIDAWYFPHTPIVWSGIDKIVEVVKKLKLPTAFEYSHVYSKVGGLVSCSSQFDLDRRVLDGVEYLLETRGKSQPIEFRPITMSVSINLDTAKAIGIELPRKTIRRFDHRFVSSEIAQDERVPLAEKKR
jgi:hypothetical protein